MKQKLNLTKYRLAAAMLTVLFAFCLTLGIVLTIPKPSYAEENSNIEHSTVDENGLLVLDKAGDFEYELWVDEDYEYVDVYISWLSEEARNQIASEECKNVKIHIPELSAFVDVDVPETWDTYLGFQYISVADYKATVIEGAEKITEVVLNEKITSLSDNAFKGMTGLTEIDLLNVERLNGNPFAGCTNLATVKMDNVAKLDTTKAFADSPIRSTLESTDEQGLTYFANILTGATDKTLATVTVKEGTIAIQDKVFQNFTNLTEISLPDGLKILGQQVFSGCTALTSCTIPASVEEIGSKIFINCYVLEELSLPFGANSAEEETDEGQWSRMAAIFFYGSTTSAKDSEGNNYYYIAYGSYSDSPVPVSLKKVTITGNTVINPGAFRGWTSLETVILGENVTAIRDNAFNDCTNLATVEMPGVTSIGTDAFAGTKYLDNLNAEAQAKGYLIVNGLLSEVYNKDTLTTFTLQEGDTITGIAGGAFSDCKKLENIDIPETVKTIGSNAFSGCSSLKEIVIPSGVTELGAGVFYNCNSLTKVTLPVKCTVGTNAEIAFYTRGTFPKAVNEVYLVGETDNLYSDFTVLASAGLENYRLYLNGTEVKEITVPAISTISNVIFKGNLSIESIVIPSTVKYIQNFYSEIFTGCNNLSRVCISDLKAWSEINVQYGGNPFAANPEGCELWLNNTKVETLDFSGTGTTSVSANAFTGAAITAVITGDLTEISSGAFKNCKSLQTLTVSDSLIKIGDSAFEGCTSLATVNIDAENSNLTTIASAAFKDCTGLTEFTIPAKMPVNNASNGVGIYTNLGTQSNQIPTNAFYGCTNIATVYDWTPVGEDGKTVINVFANELTNGRVAQYANTVITRNGTNVLLEADENGYVFYEEGSSNTNYLYKYVGTETELTLPVGYKGAKYQVWHDAFNGNKTITKLVILADSVSVINDKAFYECTALTSVEIHAIDEIGNSVFNRCSQLRSVTILDGSTKIGSYSFADCTNLSDLSVNKGDLTEIGSYAFKSCKSLGALVLPDSVTKIGASAFYDCTSLAIITYGDKIEEIGDFAFAYTKIKTAVIPAKVTRLNASVFSDCKNLETVTFAEGSQLTSIYYSAFERSGVKRLEIPDTVTSIWAYAFNSCSNLEYLKLPLNLDWTRATRAVAGTPDYKLLYANCNNLKTIVLPGAFSERPLSVDKVDGGWQHILFDVSYISQIPADTVFIAPTKEFYNELMSSSINNSYKSRIYYVDTFTFILKQGEEELGSVEVEKLVSNSGASVNYVWNNGYWAIDEDYKLPSSVGMYYVDNTQWGVGETLTTASAKSYVQTVTELRIGVPEAQTMEYGVAITVPEAYEDSLEISRILRANGNQVYYLDTALDVGTYTVYVTLKEGYAWSDGSTEGEMSYQVTITPATIDAVWTYDGKTEIPAVEYTGFAGYKSLVQAAYGTQNLVTLVYRADDPAKTPLNTIVDVGTYVFEIITTNYPNYVVSNPTQEFVITPAVLDIGDIVKRDWDVNGSVMLDGTVYIYTHSGADYPSAMVLSNGDKLKEVRNVINSYARYRNEDLTASFMVSNNEKYKAAFSGNKGKTEGIYTSTVTLTALENYYFTLNGMENLSARGLSVVINADGTATVTKVWYILNIGNELLVAEEGDDFGKDYFINNWTFGDDVTISAPRLMHGDESADWANDSSLVTFVLSGVNEMFGRDEFAYYINASMPAGTYTLRASVGATTAAAEHVHWWNDEEHPDDDGSVVYQGFTREYTFTVYAANIVLNLEADENGYADYEWKYNAENKTSFFAEFAEKLEKSGIVNLVTVDVTEEKAGYWAENGDYSDYRVVYNLSRMNTDIYYMSNDADLLDNIVSGVNATFTVYFDISALNHNDLTDRNMEGRYAYFFTVTVYETVELPEVSSVQYTGSRVQPTVTHDNPSLYETLWDTTEGAYINGGRNSNRVTFRLNDSTHYRWIDADGKEMASASVTVNFAITAAPNGWERVPNILSWEYGNFNAETNLIIAVPRYIDAGKKVYFSVSTTEDEEGIIEGLADFTVEDDKVTDETIIENLKKLKATDEKTWYYLLIRVEDSDTDNYTTLSDYVTFRIAKATNTWVVTPNVMQWRFGGYDKNVNLVLAQDKLGGTVKFKVTSDKEGKNVLIDEFSLTADGLVPETAETEFMKFAVNTYYLWAVVAGTDSYTALTPAPFEFSVTIATNYWDEAPAIETWIVGKYNEETNLISAKPHFGVSANVHIVITVAGDSENVIYDSATGLNNLKDAKVGVYELTATLAGTSDYAEMSPYTITFRVFEKEGLPWWATLLIVIGSLGIAALVLFILHQKGILQMLTGKVIIAMRTKATVDATIAAVRANKVAARARETVAAAEAKDAEEARKKAIAEAKARPIEEQAADLDSKAQAAAAKAERIQKRAAEMQKRAAEMKENSAKTEAEKPAEAEKPVEEAKPAEAEKPVEEAKPAEAEKPVEEAKPAEAENEKPVENSDESPKDEQ